jgi:exopolyphosphatase
VLEKAGTTSEEVITLSELPSPSDLKPEDTRWVLVDHNALTGLLARNYSAQVVGCIDHHADEDAVPKDAKLRVIEKTGSCMSLVIRECKSAWEERDSSSAELDGQLAHLALAPILTDTHKLLDENKTTDVDREAVTFLEDKVTKGSYDRSDYYDGLDALKSDLSSLSLRDILRKDYKEWDEAGLKLGTSSVPRDFDFLVRSKTDGDIEGLVEAMAAWSGERAIDLVAVMTTCTKDGVFGRGLLLWARGSQAVEAARRFEKHFGQKLGLASWGHGRLGVNVEGDWRRCWDQSGVQFSRKQIAPMLRDAMKAI